MTQPFPVITQPPPGVRDRARFHLRSRRFAAAGVLAAVEALYFVFARPGLLLGSVVALGVLAGSVALLQRAKPGLWSDLLVVVAIAQGFVLLVPMLLGFSIAIGLVVGAVLVIGLVLAVIGSRR